MLGSLFHGLAYGFGLGLAVRGAFFINEDLAWLVGGVLIFAGALVQEMKPR